MVELAVFGAVLFFLIGGIASNYMSGSFQQNSQLKAMRMALLSSYKASKTGERSRASSSFMLLDDRLTGEFGKYGTTERQPVMVGGGGMLSAQLMQETEWNEPTSLPIMDLFINGEAIALRTNAYVQYVIALKTGAAAGSDGVQIVQLKPVKDSDLTVPAGSLFYCAANNETCEIYADGDSCGSAGPCEQMSLTKTYLEADFIKNAVMGCLGGGGGGSPVINCNAGSDEQHKRLTYEWVNLADKEAGHGGMPPFFLAIMRNNKDFSKETSDAAFNYRRNYFDTSAVFPAAERDQATWRWSWAYFWEPKDGEVEETPSKNIKKNVDAENGSYPSYDIDGDLREETIYYLEDVTKAYCSTGSCQKAYWVKVTDPKGADVDPQKQPKDFTDPNQKPGLRPDMKIHGQTACVATTSNDCKGADAGTYLDVKEGKLFSDGKPVSVSTAKKDQYDIVERAYQLNVNMVDTEGFMKLNPTITGCSGASSQKTCFDSGTKTIYIRSRLNDQRGRKWLTDTGRTWDQSLGGK